MMRSYLLAGFLAALSGPTYGLVFKDKIKQNVEGSEVPLLHSIEDLTSVRFGNPNDLQSQSWKFDTEGLNDDEAVVTPLDSTETLICEQGSRCKLDPEGSKQAYRLTRVDAISPIFTIQDAVSSLYVSRSSDLYLELSSVQDDSSYFKLEAILGEYLRHQP